MIEKVEQITGYKVSIGSGVGFSNYAQMVTASLQKPMHVITVNQNYSKIGDYIVALQCAMILAKWTDPRKIPNFAVNDEKLSYQIDKCIKDKKLQKFPPDIARQFATTVVNGLLHQLLSLPVEMIAINICRKECQGLNDIMETAINNEIQELHKSLSPKIRQITPDNVFNKNAAMNAAFTLNWSRISGKQHIMVPFKTIEIIDEGEDLLNIYDDILNSNVEIYTKVVDGWAQKLKLATLYEWTYKDEKK